jgi:hypothetical protein
MKDDILTHPLRSGGYGGRPEEADLGVAVDEQKLERCRRLFGEHDNCSGQAGSVNTDAMCD